ncbi:hypothetical protein [Cupriavidus sp. M-11]|uniref:hypothetical protein n=1 Tax=Cupriavidus sp. M-11 TaxID=3233038 RepID=UPI003F8F6F6D
MPSFPIFKFPFKNKAGKEVRDAALYYKALSLADNGFYPLGPSGVHCGIHYVQAMANTLSLDEGMGAIAKGDVIAYQVNRDYPTVPGMPKVPMTNGSAQTPFSTGFVLTRHTLEYPAGNTLTYFCLAMHLRSFNDYERLGARVKRPDYWPATAYRVTQKASDKQASPQKDKQGSPKQSTATSATDPVVVGVRICSQPNPKGVVLGILPRGARITAAQRSADKHWVKISSVLEGKIAPPSTAQLEPLAGAAQGWVLLAYLEAQGKAPEAFDSVVTPASAIAIKAGALLGHLGEYRRIKDPGQDRVILHHEIIVGPELRSFLDKSRAAAASAKLQEKTLLRIAPNAKLRNVALAEPQAGLLAANTVVELDGTPHEDALYVKVKPIQTMQWIERKPVLPKGAKGTGDALPKGATDAKLFRHSNGTPYAAKDIVRPPKQGTAGKQGATLFRGILLAAASSEPVWMTKQAFNALYALEKGKLLVADLAQGWSSFPLTFVDNGPANGPYPQRFDTTVLEQARPLTRDPSQPPTVYAMDEAGKRWWQVQISDDTTTAIGWAGEAGHAGVSLHSPHEWVDFQLIESKPKGEGYGNIFTTLDQMTAFQGGELALNDAQLDEPMRKVFASLDTTPDHRLTLGELQAAQRSRCKLGELSRLIIRYPSEWKADPASWNAWDKNVPPSAQPAWQSEKARIAKLMWWDDVAGKVERFPTDPFVFHIHPVALAGNFSGLTARLERLIREIGDIISDGEGGYESYNSGTKDVPDGKVGHSYMSPPPGTVTGKTIDQIISTDSSSGTDTNRLFATGKYQTTISTLKLAKTSIALTGAEKYDANMQERVFSEFLLDKAGGGALSDFIKNGKGTIDDALYAAAKEWASIAAPNGRTISNGTISNGTSSYHQSAANSASTNSTNKLRSILKEISEN